MYLAAFDPGETTGYAEFDEKGELIGHGQLSFEKLVEYCEKISHPDHQPTVVVCEDFKIFKHKAQKFVGNRMETIQAIGVIRAMANKLGAKYVLQGSDKLVIACKWTQVPMPKDHSRSHWVSAFNHGAFYLIQQGIRKTELERSASGGM